MNYSGSEVDLADDKVGGTQIPQVQILVFESDSPQQHLLGFELSWGNYSHSGTNLYHLTFVRRSEGFRQTEANLKPLLIWCSPGRWRSSFTNEKELFGNFGLGWRNTLLFENGHLQNEDSHELGILSMSTPVYPPFPRSVRISL